MINSKLSSPSRILFNFTESTVKNIPVKRVKWLLLAMFFAATCTIYAQSNTKVELYRSLYFFDESFSSQFLQVRDQICNENLESISSIINNLVDRLDSVKAEQIEDWYTREVSFLRREIQSDETKAAFVLRMTERVNRQKEYYAKVLQVLPTWQKLSKNRRRSIKNGLVVQYLYTSYGHFDHDLWFARPSLSITYSDPELDSVLPPMIYSFLYGENTNMYFDDKLLLSCPADSDPIMQATSLEMSSDDYASITIGSKESKIIVEQGPEYAQDGYRKNTPLIRLLKLFDIAAMYNQSVVVVY